MGLLSIDAIQPGMVLASEVIDKNGHALLRAGVTLTEKHLKVFRTWGISKFDIEGTDREQEVAAEPRPVEINENILDQARVKAAELFRHTDGDHPAVKELLRLYIDRTAGKIAQGDTHGA